MTTLEITLVSAQGLNQHSYFITLTKLPAHVVYNYDGGGTGEQVFRVPLDPTFFSDTYSRLHLQLYNKRRFAGPTQLGWCLIPPSDIALLPYDSVRYLSYRLRAKDGSKSHVIVNLSIRFHGTPSWLTSPHLDTCQTVIGIPITAVRKIGDADSTSTSGSTSGHSKMET